ncbi:DUF547 domain-containing protein [Altererythrobacter sp. GH1-8]|uniref:DUF547 domain-containing protein n=1 Tax=Altererythrobacter sp. GH1-8 TaxID=3349333 RepID=UPI00374D4835
MALPKYSRSSSLIAGALVSAALVAPLAAPASAQAEMGGVLTIAAPAVDPAFERFSPSTARIEHHIDYSAWDEAIRYIVFPMGRSLRQVAGRPESGLGTRRQYGHDSRYRLEGNRVMFSFFDDALRASIRDYRAELEATPDLIEFNRIPRNEQLAYWINLHNVALVEKIGESWPVRQPSTIEIDGVLLDEAKFITVSGVKMSPKDIRTQIVFRHWKDPRVIYAFWRGDIGGPSIQRGAFDVENLDRLLDRGASDFINSLRGVQKRDDRLQVSKIYEEAAPFYFKDWEQDLRTHLAQHAETEVQQLLSQTRAVDATIYEADIADLAGGVREPSYSNVTTDGSPQRFRIPQGMAALLREHGTKMERIEREGRTGTVYFADIQLPGEDPAKEEIE